MSTIALLIGFAAGYWIGLSPHTIAARVRAWIAAIWTP